MGASSPLYFSLWRQGRLALEQHRPRTPLGHALVAVAAVAVAAVAGGGKDGGAAVTGARQLRAAPAGEWMTYSRNRESTRIDTNKEFQLSGLWKPPCQPKGWQHASASLIEHLQRFPHFIGFSWASADTFRRSLGGRLRRALAPRRGDA